MKLLNTIAIVLCLLNINGVFAQTHACEDNYIIPDEQKEITNYIAEGNLEKIKTLDTTRLKYVDEYYGYSYLFNAVKENKKDIINYLLEIGLDINQYNYHGESLLFYCADNLELTAYLIENGTNVNKQDNDGQTAIMISAQQGNIDVVRLYIESNADLSLKDKEGKTVLDYSNGMTKIEHKRTYQPIKDLLKMNGASSGYILREAVSRGTVEEVEEILKSAKSKPNVKDQFGSTALVYTCNVQKLELLYKYGIDLNIKNQDDLTGLIFASRKGCYDAVKFYIEHGADINAKQGTRTALDNAETEEIIALLISNGAKKGNEIKN